MDRVAALEERGLLLAGGERVPCDVLVVAYGLKYQAEPPCLSALGIGARTHAAGGTARSGNALCASGAAACCALCCRCGAAGCAALLGV